MTVKVKIAQTICRWMGKLGWVFFLCVCRLNHPRLAWILKSLYIMHSNRPDSHNYFERTSAAILQFDTAALHHSASLIKSRALKWTSLAATPQQEQWLSSRPEALCEAVIQYNGDTGKFKTHLSLCLIDVLILCFHKMMDWNSRKRHGGRPGPEPNLQQHCINSTVPLLLLLCFS